MVQRSPSSAIADFIRMRIAVYNQKSHEVFKRNAGDRLLVGPYPASDEAILDWEFALLSVAAYGRSNPQRQPIPAGASAVTTVRHMWRHKRQISAPCTPDVDDKLNAAGWKRWADFPDPTLEKAMGKSHLRAEVWENVSKLAVVAAFGGTVFTSGKDWRSNLRWFFPKHKDEYSEIVQRFGPDFVKALAIRANEPDMAYLKEVKLYSTGHSLGGGLAQQFAYSLPRMEGMPKVSGVYAFDPSPVTGFYSVNRAIRNFNKGGLQIARIYERGELLAILRSFTSLIFKPSSVNPTIRGVRFSLFYSFDPIAGHSMIELANKMRIEAGIREVLSSTGQRGAAETPGD